MEGFKYTVVVELSTVSKEILRRQQQLIDRIRLRGHFGIQFILLSRIDLKGLDLIKELPRQQLGRTPMGAFLTGLRTEQQMQADLALRPLASIAQVQTALTFPEWQVRGLLNLLQQRACEKALQRPFSIVQGPPGTGKTTFLVFLVTALLNLEADPAVDEQQEGQWEPARRQAVRARPQHLPGNILVCTPSNQAADEVAERLLRSTNIPRHFITRVYARSIEGASGSLYGRSSGIFAEGSAKHIIRGTLEEHSLHFKARNGHHSKNDYQQLKLERDAGRPGQQKTYDAKYERDELQVMQRSRVIITTCGASMSHQALRDQNQNLMAFTTVIIDEAAQASEPEVVLPSLAATKRVVLIGDHKQLGPVITENHLCRAYVHALETPMLERLHDKNTTLTPPNTMLKTQYRMHPSIRMFPSARFYHSQLEDDVVVQQRQSAPSCIWTTEERVMFIDCVKPHSFGLLVDVGKGCTSRTFTTENNTSLQNLGEAEIIALLCRRLFSSGECEPSNVAVITPYRAQQEEIRARIERLPGGSKALKEMAIGTVHSLQGAERDVTLLSFVRSTAEGQALLHGGCVAGAGDVVVSAVAPSEPALRQTWETSIGIVSNSQMLNVALTRARCGLVCVGNTAVLSAGSDDFFELIEDLRGRGCVSSEEAFRSPQGHLLRS